MGENKKLLDAENENIIKDVVERYVQLEAQINAELRGQVPEEEEGKSERKSFFNTKWFSDKDPDRRKLDPKTGKNMQLKLTKITESVDDFKKTQRDFIKRGGECVKQMRGIASALDKFHKGSIIASVAGSSFGIAGGILTIVGLCLTPVTFGASLIVTGVGIGVATAGGLTGAAASVADRVNIQRKCKKVEEFIKELNNMKQKMQDLLGTIDLLINEMIDLLGLNADIARVGTRGAYTAVEIARLVQVVRISASAARGAQIAARGAQAAAAVSGVLAALFIVVDIGFVVKGAMELSKGAKCEEAAKIREIADGLEEDCKKLKLNEKDCSEKMKK
uniref:Apolipoprotein L3 n=1 Tax=Leptobrachium leishanense TaxID=445787 RepID=A0A8C5QI44_9ANUR